MSVTNNWKNNIFLRATRTTPEEFEQGKRRSHGSSRARP